MSWTEERVELLRKLWGDGLSAAQVAAELGPGITRNAVIGKIHRLGLAERAKTSSVPQAADAQDAKNADGGSSRSRARRDGQCRPGLVSERPRRARAANRRGKRDSDFRAGHVDGVARVDVPLAAWRSDRRGIPLLRSQIAGRLGPVLLPIIRASPTSPRRTSAAANRCARSADRARARVSRGVPGPISCGRMFRRRNSRRRAPCGLGLFRGRGSAPCASGRHARPPCARRFPPTFPTRCRAVARA